MGLRDRIKQGLKRALGATPEAPPAAPVPPVPPVPPVARAAPPVPAPEPAVEAVKVAEAARVAEAAKAAEAARAAELERAVEAAAVPASKLPKGLVSDNDAPLRDAHLRGTFNTTGSGFVVRLLNPALGIDLIVPCEPGEYVLEAADRAGYEMPASCRTGGCLTCAAKLVSGDSDMIEQYTLEEEHIAEGFRLLCCTTVSTDATFITHQQDEIH